MLRFKYFESFFFIVYIEKNRVLVVNEMTFLKVALKKPNKGPVTLEKENEVIFLLMTVFDCQPTYNRLSNLKCFFEILTIDNQFASCLIGIADTLEVASVRDLGVLDHDLAFATLLHNNDALISLQWLIIFEPGKLK